ncbi:hypothetical protein FISHEDRAFT_41384 [Fistulina hepatica ATCC 64428]|nr:hypothetical protein FISHEDRAFT_41384 [Fistulina hepatica ATCC 64428]
MFAVASAHGQCKSGSEQCCNSSSTTSDPSVIKTLESIGVSVAAGIPVGLTCTPVTVIGTGSASCEQQTLCCSGNSYENDAVVLGCTPVNVNA